MYQVKSNEFIFNFSAEQIEVLDLLQTAPHTFHIIDDHRSVTACVTEIRADAKLMKIEVDGECFEVSIKEELELMMEKMGFGLSSGKHIKEIKAPMPGLVLQIAVTDGQEVAEGDKILILEAMKMENSILIPTTATIKRIAVKPGQAVEKGQLLVELE